MRACLQKSKYISSETLRGISILYVSAQSTPHRILLHEANGRVSVVLGVQYPLGCALGSRLALKLAHICTADFVTAYRVCRGAPSRDLWIWPEHSTGYGGGPLEQGAGMQLVRYTFMIQVDQVPILANQQPTTTVSIGYPRYQVPYCQKYPSTHATYCIFGQNLRKSQLKIKSQQKLLLRHYLLLRRVQEILRYIWT